MTLSYFLKILEKIRGNKNIGQYFQPTNLDRKENICPHDYDNGTKLMEHSYIGNDFMMVVEGLLSPGGKWYKNRLVWAGDYADEERGKKYNLYGLIEKKIKPRKKISYRYIINHSKEEYVDKRKINEDKLSLTIHPLSLLTYEGNGRGGGDFQGEDYRIGIWARDRISVEDNISRYKNYEEIDGAFREGDVVVKGKELSPFENIKKDINELEEIIK